MPDAFVVHSAELLREPPEFERASTTVINATLMPVVTAYLSALERRLREAGFDGRLAVMHSGGGLMTVASAARFPARLVTSGPAAGAKAAEGISGSVLPASGSPAAAVVMAQELAREEGLDQVISLDIGPQGLGIQHEGQVQSRHSIVEFDLWNGGSVALLVEKRWSMPGNGTYRTGFRVVAVACAG